MGIVFVCKNKLFLFFIRMSYWYRITTMLFLIISASTKHLHHHVCARYSMLLWTAPCHCLMTAQIRTWTKQRKAWPKYGTTYKSLTTQPVYMMGPSPAMYGHSKCDVSLVHDCNQMRWPQLDFSPELTRHLFVCSAMIFFNFTYTQQLPCFDPIWVSYILKLHMG